MKALFLQCASGHYEAIQREAAPWHEAYCARHGIDYRCHFGRVNVETTRAPRMASFPFPTRAHAERHVMWDRLPLIQAALREGYELVVWVDSDALVVDVGVDVREATTEFTDIGMARHPTPFGKHPWHYNNGVGFYRNTEKTRELLRQTDAIGQIPNAKWRIQSTMLTVDVRIGAISRVDDRWNSTEGMNESPTPVVRAWHGQHEKGIPKLRAVLRKLQGLAAEAVKPRTIIDYMYGRR